MVRGSWKQPECPSLGEWMYKTWMLTLEYSVVIRCNKLDFPIATRIDSKKYIMEWKKQQKETLTQYHSWSVNTQAKNCVLYVQGHIATHRSGCPWWAGGVWAGGVWALYGQRGKQSTTKRQKVLAWTSYDGMITCHKLSMNQLSGPEALIIIIWF